MVIQERPLKYKNIEELREHAKLDSAACRQIEAKTPSQCLVLLIKLTDTARLNRRTGEAEQAYIFYKRSCELCGIVNAKDLKEFKRTPDFRRYFDLSKQVLDEILDLVEEIELRYKLRDEDNQSTSSNNSVVSTVSTNVSRSALQSLTRHPLLLKDSDTHIKPTQIVYYAEELKSSVLVLDYRKEKKKVIKYKPVSVINIDPTKVTHGCILSMLVSVVDISERPLLQRIAHFDLVILLGDDEMNAYRTNILIEALTTYNLRERLKRPPLIMKRGFNEWELTYRCYTTVTETCKYEQTLDDAFGSMLAEALEANKLDISYPDLTMKKQPQLYDSQKKSMSKQSENSVAYPTDITSEILQPNSESYRPVPAQRNIRPSSPANTLTRDERNGYVENTQSTTFPVNGNEDRKPKSKASSPQIPRVDRTTKPTTAQHQKPTSFPVDEPTVNNKESNDPHTPDIMPSTCGAAAVAAFSTDAMRCSLPQVQTLGGAKIAPIPPSNGTNNSQPPLQPAATPRPIVPDRSTKASLLNAKQPSQLFYQVYEAAFRNIGECSKRGNVPPGYTGLANKQYGTMGVISACFASLVDAYWKGEYSAIKPLFFLETFAHRVNSSLADRRQHDAQEFQIYLLDALHEDTNKITQREPFEQNFTGHNLIEEADKYIKQSQLFSSSIVNDFFNLRTVSRLSCTVCTSASVTFEEMNQISVELPSASAQRYVTLNECLQRHFADVLLDGQSCWNCPQCKAPRVAGRSTKIWMLPRILVVHMKRFSLEGGDYVKNEIDVSFDIAQLDMSRYMHEKAPYQKAEYSLYAVTNHNGRLNSGHYTSFTKNLQTGEWLEFDDEKCLPLSQAIVSKKAFILYYANTEMYDGNKL
ncbi:ubiquitin carboxyl-terminal hydrolase domain-containing protein [Ditylenchus destructor]|nr:ubiquitin carboxyl-terminal hydrolase domain-containing protein [Ditylenchus destructor]